MLTVHSYRLCLMLNAEWQEWVVSRLLANTYLRISPLVRVRSSPDLRGLNAKTHWHTDTYRVSYWSNPCDGRNNKLTGRQIKRKSR